MAVTVLVWRPFVAGVIALVLAQAIADAVDDLSHTLPRTSSTRGGTCTSASCRTRAAGDWTRLKAHAGNITRSVGRAAAASPLVSVLGALFVVRN